MSTYLLIHLLCSLLSLALVETFMHHLIEKYKVLDDVKIPFRFAYSMIMLIFGPLSLYMVVGEFFFLYAHQITTKIFLMNNNNKKVQLIFNPNMNAPTTGVHHNEITPRAEIVFVQTDTAEIECYLNCTPQITKEVKEVPKSQHMAFLVFNLLGRLVESGELMQILNFGNDSNNNNKDE